MKFDGPVRYKQRLRDLGADFSVQKKPQHFLFSGGELIAGGKPVKHFLFAGSRIRDRHIQILIQPEEEEDRRDKQEGSQDDKDRGAPGKQRGDRAAGRIPDPPEKQAESRIGYDPAGLCQIRKV